MKPCQHDSRPLYDRLIGPLRETACRLGYALAVHGSLKRDIDLIACPWTAGAVPAAELAAALWLACDRELGQTPTPHQLAVRVAYTAKPHGRRAYSHYLTAMCDGPYIDLSVMPRLTEDPPPWTNSRPPPTPC